MVITFALAQACHSASNGRLSAVSDDRWRTPAAAIAIHNRKSAGLVRPAVERGFEPAPLVVPGLAAVVVLAFVTAS